MALRRFSDNPAATLPLSGGETIPALQSGVDVQVTVSDIVDAASSAVTSVNGQTGAVQIDAEDVPYDNASSGISATDVQAAIDEIAAATGGGSAPVVTLAGTSYDMGDLTPGAWHVFTSSSPVTITVEDDATEAVPANAEYGLESRGSGGVTLVEDNLATIIPPKGGTLELEEADFAVLKRTDTDEYKLVGSTVAA